MSVSLASAQWDWHGNLSSFRAPAHVGELLLRTARFCPDAQILGINAGTKGIDVLSYSSLLEDARRIAGGLRASGCRPGSPVVLLLDRPFDFVPTFWGCVLGGYVPCPLAPIRTDCERCAQQIEHLNGLLDRPLFVTTRSMGMELPEQARSAEISGLRLGAALEAVHETRGQDPAILMLTSGSTGRAKAVELTHGNLLASLAGRAARQQLSATDTMFNWIAFDHVPSPSRGKQDSRILTGPSAQGRQAAGRPVLNPPSHSYNCNPGSNSGHLRLTPEAEAIRRDASVR